MGVSSAPSPQDTSTVGNRQPLAYGKRRSRRPGAMLLVRINQIFLLTLVMTGCSVLSTVHGDPLSDTEFLTTSSTVTPVKLTTTKSKPTTAAAASTLSPSTQHVLVSSASTSAASSSAQSSSTAKSTTVAAGAPTDKPSSKLDKKGEPFLGLAHEFQQLKTHRDRIANATKDSSDKDGNSGDKLSKRPMGGGSFGLGLLNPPLNPSLLQQHHLHQQQLIQQALNANANANSNSNETIREREALQEEGSYHQPVVFVGGPGYIPPNNLRPRPILEATDPLWQERPLIDTRYPVPLQAAWDRNYRNPFNMTRVQHIEAECQDDFMKIRVAFNGSFQGLIYSSGYSYDPDCVYINGTGRDYYEYLIRLNRCGTLGASNHVEGRKEPSKNFMWNTVTVQYNPMIEEEWDEHFKVTCEYGYDFWKTVTFPFLDVEVATGNPVVFTLTPPECYMEVRYGFGASGTRVGGPVRVGDPLTLMIYMRSQYDGFDIVVNDCYAHNGASKRIQLIDHYGCPVDSKLMSPFRGTWSHTTVYETQVYAYLKTFRFTGSPALYIECDVRMCHGQCPSQPCYWRNVKNVRKRSVDSNTLESNFNSTLSEKMNLFQALKVLQEDEEIASQKTETENSDSVCLKTGVFTALFGLGTVLLTVVGMVSMITCVRLRRVKLLSDCNASDILRPYSTTPPIHHHHLTTHAQHQQRPHWSNSSMAKSRVP